MSELTGMENQKSMDVWEEAEKQPSPESAPKSAAKPVSKTRMLTGLALLTAIVVVLQLIGTAVRFGPFSVSFVLIPIVIGSALYGPLAGAWLGFVFGFVVLVTGGAAVFMPISPIGAIVICIAKGTLAGLLAGLVYKPISKANETVATMVAAVVAPVVNTGVFLGGCALCFYDTLSGWASAAGFDNLSAYMIVGLVGLNFVFELLVNIILSPVIVRLVKLARTSAA